MNSKFDFPKIDLHLHLDGAIAPETLLEMGLERGLELPARELEEFTKHVIVSPDCRSVNEYLDKFDLPTLILQDANALERVAYELVVRCASQGLGYAEIRFAPQLHTQKGMTQKQAVEAVAAGIARGEKECPPIKTGLILCAMVFGDASLTREANLETVRLTSDFIGRGVVACDLAGAEGLVPLSDFADVFELARALRVPFTCHAGDSQGPETVRTAICEFGACRIGHGHHIFDDKELCRLARDMGVTLEICPTSNIQCQCQPSFAQHPIKKLYDMGVRVTVNTDNPVIAGTSLDNEYEIVMRENGFTLRDIIQMNIYSAAASFMDNASKTAYIERLYACLDKV